SVPLELQATVPHCMVPFVPLHKRGTPAFSMFKDLQKKHRDWVGRVRRYSDEHALLAKFDEVILAPALEVRRRLHARKAEDSEGWDVDAPDSTQSTSAASADTCHNRSDGLDQITGMQAPCQTVVVQALRNTRSDRGALRMDETPLPRSTFAAFVAARP